MHQLREVSHRFHSLYSKAVAAFTKLEMIAAAQAREVETKLKEKEKEKNRAGDEDGREPPSIFPAVPYEFKVLLGLITTRVETEMCEGARGGRHHLVGESSACSDLILIRTVVQFVFAFQTESVAQCIISVKIRIMSKSKIGSAYVSTRRNVNNNIIHYARNNYDSHTELS